MAQRYFRVDVDFFHKTTCHKLLAELGPWGPLVFLSMIARAKDGIEPGVFAYQSEAVAWEKLGFDGHDIPFTLDEFLRLTGRMKQTAKTRVGRTMNVKISRYGDWQKDAERYEAAIRNARKRGQTPRNSTVTQGGTAPYRKGGPSSTSISTPKPPQGKTQNGRHPHGREWHHHDCPTCGARQPSLSALEDHLRIFHDTATADTHPDDIPL